VRVYDLAVPRRLTELAATLALAADTGHGAPYEHQLRVTVLAGRIAAELGLSAGDRCAAYDAALLRWLGCTATAQPLAAWMGDEIAAHQRAARFARPVDPLLEIMRNAGAGLTPHRRVAVVLGALRAGPGVIFGSACEAGAQLADRLGYSGAVTGALAVAFERFDGKGWPGRLAADAIPVAAKVAMLAEETMTLVELSDAGTALAEVQGRAGTRYDPLVATALRAVAGDTLRELETGDAWAMVVTADPAPERFVPQDRVADALLVVADFVDLKIPGMAGHSRGVAELATRAARGLGLPEQVATQVRHAGLVHDLGRVAVSNAVWERAGPLSSADRELVRLHPYHVERFCARSDWLAPLGGLAALHQERLDGSGYHRGLSGSALSLPARILAAADCYHALTEPRPHRPAHSAAAAADLARAEVRSGRLDADATEAVLAAAGQTTPRRRTYPAGLTAREVEVLGLLAQGLSNKQIAARLVLSARTVGHHVAHIYDKAAVGTRAGATLFALRHDLIQREDR
jgi:HD-GYP domain-containing protein (c-di-GMP phosphodiesterase class II)